MKARFCSIAAAALMMTGVNSFGGSHELAWTDAADSVPGIVFEALKKRFQGHEQLKVKKNDVSVCTDLLSLAVGTLTVQEEGQEIVVEAGVRSAGVIVQYRMTMSDLDFGWTSTSNSVAAVLFESLLELRQLPVYAQFIRSEGRSLIVEDDTTKLVCQAGTLGMAMVMSYKCEFSSKEVASVDISQEIRQAVVNAVGTAQIKSVVVSPVPEDGIYSVSVVIQTQIGDRTSLYQVTKGPDGEWAVRLVGAQG